MLEALPNTMPDAVRAREVVTSDAHIGRYRIVRRLEVNETSELVLAMTEGALGFERTVIIKRLLPHAHADAKRAKSFGCEASAYARLTHPAIVRLYDFLTIDEMPSMVLEHVNGISLHTLLAELRTRGEKLPLEAALYIGARVFAALSAAHAARDQHSGALSPVVHRDVSPSNVLLAANGDVKLSNFGFAKLVGTAATDMSMEIPKGTLGYMAPEQLLGDPITPRTDVYAAALLVRELVSGEPAFLRGEEPYVDYLQAMAMPTLAPIAKVSPGLPRAVADALRIALEPASDKRTLSAVDMQRVLHAHREGGRAKLKDVVTRLALVTTEESDATDDADDSSVTVPSMVRLESRVRRARLAAAIFAGCALLCGVVAVRSSIRVAQGRTAPAPSSAIARNVTPPQVTPAPLAVAPPPLAPPPAAVAPAPVEPPPVEALAAQPVLPLDGELQIPASTPAHRVFIDGHLAGVSGATFTLSCGTHRVRIGSGGRVLSVSVPCGGTTALASR